MDKRIKGCFVAGCVLTILSFLPRIYCGYWGDALFIIGLAASLGLMAYAGLSYDGEELWFDE